MDKDIEAKKIVNDLEISKLQKADLLDKLLSIISRNKVELILELIEESIDRFSDYNFKDKPYIEIRPVLDSINLLLMKNIAIQIFDNNNNNCSTYNVKGLILPMKEYTLHKLGEKYKFHIAEKVSKKAFKKLNGDDLKLVRKLFKGLNRDSLKTKIENAIKYESNKESIEKISFRKFHIEQFEGDFPHISKEIITKLRELISDSLKLIENNESLTITELGVPNVFTVIRYASNKRMGGDKPLNYTAQILLSENQKNKISSRFIDDGLINNIEEFLDYFEDPLDESSRSSADECFRFETVRFEDYSENLSKSTTDRNRNKLETKLYDHILKGEKRVFYIPIHLNGSPWIALYRIMPKNRSDIDYINFYRSKISHIANQIRTRSFEIFFNLFRIKLRELFISNRNEIRASIFIFNKYCKVLSCYFPFYIPLFPENTGLSKLEYLKNIANESFEMKYYVNEIWENKIDYDNISINEFEKKVKRNIGRISNELSSEESTKRIIMAAYGMSHFYGNRLDYYRRKRAKLFNQLKVDCNSYDSTKTLRKEVLREFDNIYNISGLFTIVSKKNAEKSKEEFFASTEAAPYLTGGDYNVMSKFQEYFKFMADGRTLNIVEIASLFIQPFVKNKRPYDVLYDNLWIEIIRNFERSRDETLNVSIVNNLLIFENKTTKIPNKKYNTEWMPLTSKEFKGAIYYFYILLNETNTGNIFYSYQKKNSEMYFRLGVELKGIKYEK